MTMPLFDAEGDTDRGSFLPSLLERLLAESGNETSTYERVSGSAYYDDGGYDSKSKGPLPLDYTVLMVGVLTLGLILFVEICRHSLDHAAHHRPFFKAVLQMLYSELATLGIVELVVFLLIKYWKNLDKQRKEVFGDVHFAIFYTAIFNAFQSVLTAMVTRRASNRLWVRTEQLELDHYVEIREEYQRVEQLVRENNSSTRYGKLMRNVALSLRHPGLLGKYHTLRVQVRFHELRLHFLESNNLPLTLKVSDYLRRSEMAVLIHLVHISAFAWLLLTGGLNLCYFLFGMVGYATANVDIVGTCMTAIFFAYIVVSVFVSLALFFKMQKVFQTIIKTNVTQGSDYDEGVKRQKSLFWWGSPQLVISLIQFMNFGYALSLSIVIMYWPYLTGKVPHYWYLISVFICYAVFLYILGLVLPQYTLCTSLGYLTNKKELLEIVALHRLEERQRQQRQELITKAFQRNEAAIVLATAEPNALTSSTNGTGAQKYVHALEPHPEKKNVLLADLVKTSTRALRTHLPEASRENLLVREQRMKERRANRKKSKSDGVAAMRSLAPWDFQGTARIIQQKIQQAEKEKRESRMLVRRKSSSQPGIIKCWQDITTQEENNPNRKQSIDDSDAALLKKESRRKSISASGVIQSWQELATNLASGPPTLDQWAASCGGSLQGTKEEDAPPPRLNDPKLLREGKNRTRRKSLSASAILQSWRDPSVNEIGHLNNPSNASDFRTICADDCFDDYHVTSERNTSTRASRTENHVFSSLEDEIDFQTQMETVREHDADDTLNRDGEANKLIVVENPAFIRNESQENARNDAEVDVMTIETDKSIGNLSDVDVVATVRSLAPNLMPAGTAPWYSGMLSHVTPVGLIHDAKEYFRREIYRSVSHVFGTMVIFFWIGFRVEAMIAKTGVFFDAHSQWGVNLKLGFWCEACWLFCFVIADFMILTSLPFTECKSTVDRGLNIAAVMDILLSGMCMTLLFVAESQRCCYGEPEQQIISGLIDSDLPRHLAADYDFENECTCPGWGGRTYTGLGVIEPFTSLIALRLFRFLFADFLLLRMDIGQIKNENAEPSTTTENDRIKDPNARGCCRGGQSETRRNMHEAGTVIELWERAISEFPDIVDKYGQFSGELLQAMLGLQVDVISSGAFALSQTGSMENQKDCLEGIEADSEKPDTWRSHIKLAGAQYLHLTPEAQGLIIAGRLGKPVKVMGNFDSKKHDDELPTVDEGGQEIDHPKPYKLGVAEFEVDWQKLSIERKTDYTFIAPFARLIRSMRRCDRKLLPVLTTWVSVDVVITQFEIVYFEAVDHDSTEDEQTKVQTNACRSALEATKGGKDLRLCDVAFGRKVVGHLDLSDVREVRVEQDEDVVSDVATLEMAASFYGDKTDMASEYWCDYDISRADTSTYPREVRWLTMQEARLKLSTESGTLFLRFYADLAHSEADMNHPRYQSSLLKKEVSFQWAESIGRIIGPQQLLKQKLPHFGEGNDDERRDYLEMQHFHEKELETFWKKRDNFPDLPKPTSLRYLRRSRSSQESDTSRNPKLSRPPSQSLRRVLSFGTNERARISTKARMNTDQEFRDRATKAGEEVGSATLTRFVGSPLTTDPINPTIAGRKSKTIHMESMEEVYKQWITAENVGMPSNSLSPHDRSQTFPAVRSPEEPAGDDSVQRGDVLHLV